MAVASFDGTALLLKGAGEKSEFETTAQYEARQAAATSRHPAGSIILSIPTNRDYVRYDADIKAMKIYAGAFPTGAYGDAPRADIAASVATFKDGKHGDRPWLEVRVGEAIRPLGTATARSIVGVAIRITNAERHTNGLMLDTPRLYGFARDKDSTVMGFEASQALALRLKQTLRTALVIVPTTPFIMTGSMTGETATTRNPVHYTERSTVIAAKPLCGLVLDAQSRVLASADAAPQLRSLVLH